MRRGMQQAQRQLNDFHRTISGTVKKIGVTLASIGVGMGIGSAIKDAMDVEAALQQVNRQMGASAAQFNDWANKSAAAFGMSRTEAIKYGAVYGNLISGFSNGTQQTFQRTQQLMQTSAIIASATGRSMDDVMERIRSGLLGETDSIEDLGINVNNAMIVSTNAFKQFAGNKSWSQLSYQTQQQILYMAILEQANKKYGDSIQQNTATNMAMFVAQLNNIKLALGQAFLPILNVVLPVLTAFAGRIAQVMSFVAQFTQALFGKSSTAGAAAQAKATTKQANAVTGLGNAIKGAGDKAKKAGKDAQGSLAGFDEINQLADKSSTASDASAGAGADVAGLSGGSIPTPDASGFGAATQEISAKARAMAEAVKKAFGDMKDFIVTNKDIILAALAGLAAGFATFFLVSKWTAITGAISNAFKAVGFAIAAVDWPIVLIAAAIAALVAAFVYFYQTNETFRGVVDGILNAIKDAAVYLWQNVLVPLGKWLGSVFVAAWNGIVDVCKILWKQVFVPLGDYLVKFYNEALVPLGKVLGGVLKDAWKMLSDIAKSFWQNVMIPLGSFLKDTFKSTLDALVTVLTFLWKQVFSPFASFLGDVLILAFKGLAALLSDLWKNILQPLGGFIVITFNTAFQGMGKVIGDLKLTITSLMKFITDVFKGDWKKAWGDIGGIFEGIWNGIKDTAKTAINIIIDGLNALISGMNKISFKAPDWVPGIGGKNFGIHIDPIPHLAKGGITNGPMMAMIGDNPGGREVVSPLSDLQDIVASAVGTAVTNAMRFSNNGSVPDIVIKVGDVELGRAAAKGINKAQRISGKLLLDL